MANKKDKYVNYSNCESVRTNSRVTKITIHCLLLQGRTPFLSCKVQELSQKHEIHGGGFRLLKVRVRVATLRDQIFARARARARACCSVDRSVRLSGVRIFEVLL